MNDLFDVQTLHRYSLDGKTSFIGVIGERVNHSAASLLCNEVFKRMDLNTVCLSMSVQPDRLEDLLKGLLAMNVKAAYVSMPYKNRILPLLDEVDPLAQVIGAVNLIVNRGNQFKGFNVDVYSIMGILKNMNVTGKRVLILGANGIGTVCAFGLAKMWTSITILDVQEERLQQLASKLRTHEYVDVSWELLTKETLSREIAGTDILINATDVGYGRKAGQTPVPAQFLRRDMIVFDAVNTLRTPLLQDAAAVGARTLNRMDMIAYNTKLLVEMLTGVKQPTSTFEIARAIGEEAYGKQAEN